MEEFFEIIFVMFGGANSKAAFIFLLLLLISVIGCYFYFKSEKKESSKHIIEYNNKTYYTDSTIYKLEDNTYKFHTGKKWVISNDIKILK